MRVWGIVVAAGAGARLGGDTPKALRLMAGVPMFVHAIRSIESSVDAIVLVVPSGWNDDALEKTLAHRYGVPVEITHGGPSRTASVASGIARVPENADIIVVHDAARPLAPPDLAARAIDALSAADGAVCATPLTDTLKRVEGDEVLGTIGREQLWLAQTPQAFRAEVLRSAHAAPSIEATDDASLVEGLGCRVVIVPGDGSNMKVTTATDFAIAEMIMENR